MLRTSTCLASLLLAASLAPSVLAQKGSCSHRILSVSVQDLGGRLIDGLAVTDFDAKLSGKPVKFLSITPDRRRHRVVILFDASSSMRQGWRQSLAPASDLAETRVPDTQMALIIFNETVTEQVDFAAGQRAVVERLRQIITDTKYETKSVRGKTALYDALLAGLRLLGPATSADILYLVTDGGENSSRVHLSEFDRLISSSGVRLFVSLVHDVRNYPEASPEETYGITDLNDVVNRTGGEMFSPFANGIAKTPNEIHQFGDRMYSYYRRMFETYLLEVEFPEPVAKNRSWELKLSKELRELRKDLIITYPTKLAGCVPNPIPPTS
jgi:hypothetical protein